MTQHPEDQTDPPPPVLMVVSGRPGTGKTTLAKEVCRRWKACYLRVDAAETALNRTGIEVGIAGYAVVHEIAVANLQLGITVVVDAVNGVPEARTAWHATAGRAHARLVLVETSLADVAEHRRRVESRLADIPGHMVPTWHDVQNDGWTAWDEDRDGTRLLVDTNDARAAVQAVIAHVASD